MSDWTSSLQVAQDQPEVVVDLSPTFVTPAQLRALHLGDYQQSVTYQGLMEHLADAMSEDELCCASSIRRDGLASACTDDLDALLQIALLGAVLY